jgi:hypothetical protein
MTSIKGKTIKVISRSTDGMRAQIVVIHEGTSTTMHVVRASKSQERFMNIDRNVDHMHFFDLEGK